MSDWIDIKELRCENIERKIIVKYENGKTSLRTVQAIFRYPWLFYHNATDRNWDKFCRRKVITHYKEIE